MASMVRAAVLCVMVVVVVGSVSQAQAWDQGHATFYGGQDGGGTMGEWIL